MVLEKIIFTELHTDLIIELDLINLVALQSNANPRSLKVLNKFFTVVPVDKLQHYAPLIGEVVRRHRRYFSENGLLNKISQISGLSIPTNSSDSLIEF